MQQSNGYIIGFSIAMTVILGSLLAVAAEGLKPTQKRQIELDTKKQILSAVMNTEGEDKVKLEDIYNKRIKSVVVNYDGEEITKAEDGSELVPEKVSIKKEYKKGLEDRLLPVFKYMNESGSVEAYIVPVYGKGLWDDIWGYLAVKPDFNTIAGVSFDHKGETPGLGARITDAEVRDRYKGKKLYSGSEFKSVYMVKGEGNSGLTDHEVDGMSGATLTGKGVNAMIEMYVKNYEKYFSKVKGKGATAAM